MMKRIFALLMALVLCLGLFAGCGGSGESQPADSTAAPTPTPQPINVYDYNLLTGEEKDKSIPDGQRPGAVMIDNLYAAWPQAGISSADVIYETVTEGGITRLMAVWADYTAIPTVGPVRSVRDQFVQLAMPMNAMLVHIGGSVYAVNLLNYYRYQDIDGYYLGTHAFAFDESRSKVMNQEHCWFTNGSMIQSGIDIIATLPTTGTLHPVFEFSSEAVTPANSAKNVRFTFSRVADCALAYNSANGVYLQSQFGEPHVDSNNGEQLAFKNVLLLYTDVSLKEDGIVSEFDMTGGTGYYFTNGGYEEIVWEKGGVEEMPVFTKKNGSALLLNPGKTYVAMVGNDRLADLVIEG